PLLAEARGLQSIARLVLHTRRQLRAILDLLLDIELNVRQLVAAWEITEHRIALPHRPRTIARDEARRDVHERRPLHALNKRNDVLRADDVRSQCTLKRRVESDVARAVDDNINLVREFLRFFFRVT